MLPPDVRVRNPLDDHDLPRERVSAELRRRVPLFEELCDPRRAPVAHLITRHVPLGAVRHRRKEFASEVSAAAEAINDDELLVSLVGAAHEALQLPHFTLHRIALTPFTSQAMAILQCAEASAAASREAEAESERAEIDMVGFVLREAPTLPDPLDSPAITFTIGLSRSGTRPELAVAGHGANSRRTIRSVARELLRKARPDQDPLQALLALELGHNVSATVAAEPIRLRVACASHGVAGLVRPSVVLELSTAATSPPSHDAAPAIGAESARSPSRPRSAAIGPRTRRGECANGKRHGDQRRGK